jgi:hypothetical protein
MLASAVWAVSLSRRPISGLGQRAVRRDHEALHLGGDHRLRAQQLLGDRVQADPVGVLLRAPIPREAL